jgi:predicted dehydrogenase
VGSGVVLDIRGRPTDKDERIRAGFIGCGSHSFRNIFPTFQFAGVNLVATCDLDERRAAAFAQQFGAERSYTDYGQMLEKERLEAVFVVTNYDDDGTPRFMRIAQECMQAGVHVWTEKPPSSSVAEVEETIRVSSETGKFVLVGFKKCFFPAIEKAKEISEKPEFGKLSTIYVRYPQYVPTDQEKPSCVNGQVRGFLDHIVHPMSIINYIAGRVNTVYVERSMNGGGYGLLRFKSGATGVIHFCHGMSGTSPLERVEIVGEGANVAVENGTKLTYYRPGERGPGGYGGAPSFIGSDDHAPICWEPEFSLGQLYNKGLFLLGYYGEVKYFADCVREGTPPTKCGLDDALEITKVFEAFMRPEGQLVTVNQ